MNFRRVWLVMLYGLATTVVPALHDHGDRREGPAAVALAGCDDPRPHYAGHGAPELVRGEPHCPACQFRADHQAVASRLADLGSASRRLTSLDRSPRARPAAVSRLTCRGPPLA